MNELDQNNVVDDNDDDADDDNDDNDENQNQGGNNNNHAEISDNEASYNDPDNNDDNSNGNQQYNYDSAGNWDNEPDADESEDNNNGDSNDIGQGEEDFTIRRRNHNMNTQGNRTGNIAPGLPSANNGTGLNGLHWMKSYICPTLSVMVVTEQAGIRMMKEYFEIEASKSTPQYGFRKGLKLFGDEGYQASKNKLETNLLGGGFIDMLSWKDITWDIRKQALGYLMFLKRK